MTRALTRTHFHSSRLIRILADLACVEAAEPGTGFAEKLGLWVDYTDAITLCAVHNNASPASPAAPAQAPAMDAEFARQRALLERAITTASLPQAEPAAGTAQAVPTASDITVAFEPYRRYYVAQQRDMELKVPPLRSRVRDAMAQAAPAQRQLAALDAALDGILAEREAKLLGALPQLLKKRFGRLLKAQHLAQADAAPDHKPAPGQQSGAWLLRFGHEMQTVLLAELDLRLQPALGLIEALHHEQT
jgi:hypothetical protein